MFAKASSLLPIKCAPTTSVIKGETKMADTEYISRLYFAYFGTPATFHGRPVALCAAKSPLGGIEQYLGSLTGRSEYIYSPNGIRGYRVFKDGDGIVQKIELFENGAPGTPDSSLTTWKISSAIGETLTSWTSERMEKNGMVATSYKFEISGPGAENGFGSQVYLRDFQMSFELLSADKSKQIAQKPAASKQSRGVQVFRASQRKQAEDCAAKMVADKKRENRAQIFRYRIVPALVVSAIIVPVLFG